MAGFIFDMDGCLLNSIGAWHAAEQHILDDAGIVLSKEQRDELNALTLDEAAAWFHDRFGIMSDGKAVSKAIVDHLLAFYNEESQANPGVVGFLEAIHEAGAPMCVLSSSPQAFIRAGLEHTGLAPLFVDELVISAEDRGWTKRNPSTFSQVCALLGTDLADTWLFDDSWYAVAIAHDVGLRTVGTFSTDHCGTHAELARYCDVVIDSFDELNPADFL